VSIGRITKVGGGGAQTDKPLEEVTPLYSAKHRLRSGKQVLTVRTTKRPGIAALDPFHKRIERSAGNNSLKIAALLGAWS
jgi:hypothetical protein